MTNFTDERGSIWFRPLHESVKTALMRVFMTTLTSQSLPVVLRRRFRFEIRGFLVTVAAWNGHVTTTQTKGSLVVAAQAECRWKEPLQVVAIFATVEMRGGGKLPGVFVGVTIGAVAKLHRIDGSFALRNMALFAAQSGMFALERVTCRRVLFQSEGRGFETIDEWQFEHSLPPSRRANWPPCGSGRWQPAHF